MLWLDYDEERDVNFFPRAFPPGKGTEPCHLSMSKEAKQLKPEVSQFLLTNSRKSWAIPFSTPLSRWWNREDLGHRPLERVGAGAATPFSMQRALRGGHPTPNQSCPA